MTATALIACVVIGIVSGFLNVLAGGGSFLTLPLLLFLGLPASIANGTNRVGVLAQNIGGVWGVHRHDVIEWRWALSVSAVAVAGAAVVGLYGGFIQAGVGFLILAMTTIAGMDLVRGNAVKVLTVMLLTVLSLAIFAGTGNVNWPLGLALERVVTFAIIVFAVLLWMTD